MVKEKECDRLILVVDDEKDIRDSVSDVLKDNHFRVVTAENGQNMLDKLKIWKPDLILLDIIMPGMITKEILDELKKRKIKTPIIFLTVVRLSEQTIDIIGHNVKDYIEKPFENNDLIRRIKKVLGC